MDFEQFNGPPMSPAQIQRYLDRVGLTGPIPLNLAGLTLLHQAHQQTVPFENLAVLAGHPVDLDHQVLFDKIVLGRRGGICGELNTLYNWLLRSLGFSVVSYNARLIAKSAPVQLRRHRLMGVRLPEGLYLTDAGTNSEFNRRPLLLAADQVQPDGLCAYRFTRDPFYGWVQWQLRPGRDWRRIVGFVEDPQIDLDFVAPMHYYSTHPHSSMNKAPKVSLYGPKEFYLIRGHSFVVKEGGNDRGVHPFATWREELDCLATVFHLEAAAEELASVPAPLG